jgi:hypothetical protein
MNFPRKYLPFALIAVALLLVGYALFGRASDEELIMERLHEVASAVETKEDETNIIFRVARIKEVFREAMTPLVSISAPELPTTSGVEDLSNMAGSVIRFSPEFYVTIGSTEVTVDGSSATAVSQVTVKGTQQGELRAEDRRVDFLLQKVDGDWQIARIEVGPRPEK